MQIRPYQAQAIESIRNEFKSGHHRVLLWMPTGSGKTFVFCRMICAASAKGKRALVVVRGRKLVDQASQRLFREDVSHGVLMAGHWNQRAREMVQVCSIDTMLARNLRPPTDLIVVDEAHMAGSAGYKTFLAGYPDAYVVSVTATPYVQTGLRHLADAIVRPITMQGLIDAGYLVPFRVFAPDVPDLSTVRVSASTHDFVNAELEATMATNALTGSVLGHWKRLAGGLPTIGFAVNIRHSRMLTEKFNSSGVKAEHCDADVPDQERDAIIKRLESGATKVVFNVGIFCTGVDIPCLRAIIMARPTKSRNLYIQQAGRGTRTFAGKETCILLDHAGNTSRHGLPADEPEVDLDGREKSPVKLSKTCKICFVVFRGRSCPECGEEQEDPPPTKIPDEDAGNLREINPMEASLAVLTREAKKTGKKPAWVFYKMIDRWGYEACALFLPDWFIRHYNQGQSRLFTNSPYTGRMT